MNPGPSDDQDCQNNPRPRARGTPLGRGLFKKNPTSIDGMSFFEKNSVPSQRARGAPLGRGFFSKTTHVRRRQGGFKKTYVRGGAAPLARALAPGIRVVSLSPGLAETDFVTGLDQDWWDQQSQGTPLGRLASPADVAAAALAIASDLSFSNGCIIPVDGGRPLT